MVWMTMGLVEAVAYYSVVATVLLNFVEKGSDGASENFLAQPVHQDQIQHWAVQRANGRHQEH